MRMLAFSFKFGNYKLFILCVPPGNYCSDRTSVTVESLPFNMLNFEKVIKSSHIKGTLLCGKLVEKQNIYLSLVLGNT